MYTVLSDRFRLLKFIVFLITLHRVPHNGKVK